MQLVTSSYIRQHYGLASCKVMENLDLLSAATGKSSYRQCRVCETYAVHHLVGIRLHCPPPTCVVHHGALGGPIYMRSGGHPRHFSFFDGSQGTFKKQTLFSPLQNFITNISMWRIME